MLEAVVNVLFPSYMQYKTYAYPLTSDVKRQKNTRQRNILRRVLGKYRKDCVSYPAVLP